MHYHVVLIDDGDEGCVETFASWQVAEQAAEAISRRYEDWVARRYPGRSSRAGEVAVYLDRRALGGQVSPRELFIVRCDGPAPRTEDGTSCPGGAESSVLDDGAAPEAAHRRKLSVDASGGAPRYRHGHAA